MAAAIEPSSTTAIGRWESVRRQVGERLMSQTTLVGRKLEAIYG